MQQVPLMYEEVLKKDFSPRDYHRLVLTRPKIIKNPITTIYFQLLSTFQRL